MPSPLSSLLPGFSSAQSVNGRRLFVDTRVPAPGTSSPIVPFSNVFAGTAATTGLVVDYSGIPSGRLYDVIVSLTYTAPVETVTASLR